MADGEWQMKIRWKNYIELKKIELLKFHNVGWEDGRGAHE